MTKIGSPAQLNFAVTCKINLEGKIDFGGRPFTIRKAGWLSSGRLQVSHEGESDDRWQAALIERALNQVLAPEGRTRYRLAGSELQDFMKGDFPLAGAVFEECDFSGFTLAPSANTDWQEITFRGCRFIGTSIKGSVLRSTFEKCDFSNAQFSGAGPEESGRFDGSFFRECDFSGAKLKGAFAESEFNQCGFMETQFEGQFRKCSFLGESVFRHCTFQHVSAPGAIFTGASFDECHFSDMHAGGVNLIGSKFIDCDLASVKLDYSHSSYVEFIDCPASGVDFRGATMEYATFVNFGGEGKGIAGTPVPMVFQETKLPFARFYDCKLRGADFREVLTQETIIIGTELEDAQFFQIMHDQLYIEKAHQKAISAGSSCRDVTPKQKKLYDTYKREKESDKGEIKTVIALQFGNGSETATTDTHGSRPIPIPFPTLRPQTQEAHSSDREGDFLSGLPFNFTGKFPQGAEPFRESIYISSPLPAASCLAADLGDDGPFAGGREPATREAFYKIIEGASADTPLVLVLNGRLWDVRDEDVYRLKTQEQLEALLGGKLEESADLPEQDQQSAMRDRRHLARIRLVHCTALTDAGYRHVAGHARADLRLMQIEARSTLLGQYKHVVDEHLGPSSCEMVFVADDEPVPAAGASAFPAGDGGHPAEPPRPAVVSLRVAPADGQAGTQSNEEVPDSGGAHPSPVLHTHEQASVSLTADPPQAKPSAGTPQPERTDAHEEASSPEDALALHTFSPLTRWAMLSFMAGTPPPAIRLVLDAKRWAVDDHDLFALQSNSNNTRVHAIHLINCTSLSGAGLNSLAHLPNLRAISIEGGGMTGAMLEGMIEQFAIQTVGRQTVPDAEGSMKHLCLAACPYTERLGVRIAYLPGLESLELRDMHAVAPIDLSFLDSMSLTSLVLAGTRCDVRTLEAVNTMESLEYWEPGIIVDRSGEPVFL